MAALTTEQRLAILTGSSSGTPVAGSAVSWVATNPAPGTPIVYAVTASYSATAGNFMSFKNNSSAGQNTLMTLDYIKLITGVVPASGTAANYAIITDVPSSNRYTSGGSAITPANPDASFSGGSVVQLNAGALTTAAASGSARIASRGSLRGVIPTINDQYFLQSNLPGGGGSFASAAASGNIAVPMAPNITIGPQQFLLLALWFPSNASTAAQFEFETSWIEWVPST